MARMFEDEFAEELRKAGWKVAQNGALYMTEYVVINVYIEGNWAVNDRKDESLVARGQASSPALALIAALQSFVS